MTIVVGVLLVAICGALGLLFAVPAVRRRPWLPLTTVVVLAGLLFVPVRCATGIAASPLHDVRHEARPTSCETITGVELPELGMFAGDTVGWGLSVAGFCLWLGVAVLVAGRTQSRDDEPGAR